MAVRTANQRAYMVGEGEFRKSIGETLVIISRHSTSCDLCKPFEGKVLIDDVYSGGTQEDGDYMLLSQAMEQGLYHPRCRHGLGTYYPELEDINGYETDDNKLNDYSETVDNSGGSGIIEMFRKGYTHRKTGPDGRKIIDKPTYQKIVSPAIKQGADIRIADSEWLEHLRKENASAVTIGDVIIFRPDATVSDVLEETYHFIQNRNGLNSDKPELLRIYLNEIDAKEYVLSMSAKYNIPIDEIELTKKQLEQYKRKLKKLTEKR